MNSATRRQRPDTRLVLEHGSFQSNLFSVRVRPLNLGKHLQQVAVGIAKKQCTMPKVPVRGR